MPRELLGFSMVFPCEATPCLVTRGQDATRTGKAQEARWGCRAKLRRVVSKLEKGRQEKAPKREEDGKKTTPRFRYRGEQAKARSQEDLGSVQPLGMGPMSWMISR